MPALLPPHQKHRNRLLSALAREEQERLLPDLERVSLSRGQILYEPDGAIRHVYFPTGGLLSILTITSEGETVEIAMVGNEGVTGVPLVMGANKSPYRVMAQIPGGAVRIRAEQIQREFGRAGRFRDLILRYTYVLTVQISQSVTCNRFHTVEQRLCRWLLVTRDRVQSDEFDLTQEFLSYMLGVPRTSVTMVACKLQRMGLISYTRGKIRITNPRGLEAAACECYGNLKQEISHLLVA